MLQLDFGDRRSLYEQIRDKMKDLIISGVFNENDKIPSVRELASNLAINPNTIQKAYKDLENEGYIYSQKNKGNFVCPREKTIDNAKVDGIYESFFASVREMKFLGVEKDELLKEIQRMYEEG